MKHKVTLTITSLLSILFMAFHWADDIVRGMSPGGVSGLGGVLILVIWLYGTLVLGERARGTAIGVRHHAARVDQWVGCPCHPHEGSGTCRRQDCQFQWSLFLGLDAHRARRDLDLLHHPLGARPVGPATGPVPLVRWQPETRSRGCSFKEGACSCLFTLPQAGSP